VNRLDAMIAISSYIRSNILQTYLIDESKVHVVRYGLGEEAVGRREMGGKIRRTLGCVGHEPLVGMVAQLSPGKRQDLFLRAAQMVSKQIPGCRFVLSGANVDRGYANRIHDLIRDLGLEMRVQVTGFFHDIPSLMQALDVVVVPSDEEAFGLVLLEAMANSRPLIASDSGAIPEIVAHDINGLLFRPGDPDSLARAITDLLCYPEKGKEMGRRGECIFRERFTLEREVTETEKLYEYLLSNGQKM